MLAWKFAALLATLSGVLLSFSGLTVRSGAGPLHRRLRPVGWVAISLAGIGIIAGDVLISFEHQQFLEGEAAIAEERARADAADKSRETILEQLTALRETVAQIGQRGTENPITTSRDARAELSSVQSVLRSALGSEDISIEVAQDSAFCADHMPYGPPSDGQYVFCRRGYALSFNLATNVADWVTYVIDPGIAGGQSGERPRHFFLDPHLPAGRGPDNRIYTQNDYDRGHLVFSRDLAGRPELRQEVFIYSAVAPQADKTNRGPWLSIERLSHEAAVTGGKKTLVYAGPILPVEPRRFYRDLVVLPEAFFRIMVDLKSLTAIAVIVPNTREVPPLSETNVSDYLVSIDEIEQKTGLDFLATLDDTLEQGIESRPAEQPVL